MISRKRATQKPLPRNGAHGPAAVHPLPLPATFIGPAP